MVSALSLLRFIYFGALLLLIYLNRLEGDEGRRNASLAGLFRDGLVAGDGDLTLHFWRPPVIEVEEGGKRGVALTSVSCNIC